jgi:hypothetical protein
MLSVIDAVMKRPRLAAGLSAVSLLDAANCIRLAHDDWWYPATVALVFAALVRRQAPRQST